MFRTRAGLKASVNYHNSSLSQMNTCTAVTATPPRPGDLASAFDPSLQYDDIVHAPHRDRRTAAARRAAAAPHGRGPGRGRPARPGVPLVAATGLPVPARFRAGVRASRLAGPHRPPR